MEATQECQSLELINCHLVWRQADSIPLMTILHLTLIFHKWWTWRWTIWNKCIWATCLKPTTHLISILEWVITNPRRPSTMQQVKQQQEDRCPRSHIQEIKLWIRTDRSSILWCLSRPTSSWDKHKMECLIVLIQFKCINSWWIARLALVQWILIKMAPRRTLKITLILKRCGGKLLRNIPQENQPD